VSGTPAGTTPRCRHFGTCGGCSWQDIDYPEQLRMKTAAVTRAVRAVLPESPPALPTLPSTPLDNPWGFRQKVHFTFGVTGQAGRRSLVMGHYARGSRRVIPVTECPVHDERGNALAFALGNAYRRGSAGVPGATLKSVAIRAAQGTPEVMATLVVTADADKGVRAATRRILETNVAPTSFHLNLHPRDDGFIFGQDTRRLRGPERMREQIGDVSYLISPTSFFQTNIRAAEILVRLVVAAVPEGARVLDLYAGAGLFAIPLAKRGHAVVAVEENRVAVGDGEASLRLNRIAPEKCRFIAAPVEQALQRPEGLRPAGPGQRLPADTVILDPPRDGCSPDVIDGVFAGIRPATVIYVSCDPDSLARDLAAIAAHGYRVNSLQPVDMFPHTPHIETVALLTRL
jgi:23S rRNA (uracil1939-C5)-methyltransferase